jgi:hypothetical protein
MEEFLEAIASQLDRAQDALAFKAINRPLTYAIRDFNLALQVFVDMDVEGNVRLRASGPNEAGASTVNIGFTTMTRPMIEENTISLAQTRTPTLVEAGFAPAERRSLERLGVRNTAQLRRLGTSTGASTVARLTSIPVERLRAALQLERSQITTAEPLPIARPTPGSNAGEPARPIPSDGTIRLAPDTAHIHLMGTNLATEHGLPEVHLDGQPVALAEADSDRIVVPVPTDLRSGVLDVTLPGGERHTYELRREATNGAPGRAAGDPWLFEPGAGAG